MACYHPITGYRSRVVNPVTGKRKIVFNKTAGFADMEVVLPCGICIGCRLERSRQWAIRCIHESKLYEKNCFVTLTYDEEHIPKDKALDKVHLQLFMKRLRKKYGEGIRFFACGEYGDKLGRPHYHLIIFNHDFDDKYPWINNGEQLYRSESLEELWEAGNCLIGDVTYDSAAYVARYINKKVIGDMTKESGEKALNHYLVKETGLIKQQEFILMSRGSKKLQTGGIGKGFLEKFSSDIYNHDYVISQGKKLRPPKYYDSKFEIENFEKMKKIKLRRKMWTEKNSDDNTPDRLAVKEGISLRKIKKLQRSLENENLCNVRF